MFSSSHLKINIKIKLMWERPNVILLPTEKLQTRLWKPWAPGLNGGFWPKQEQNPSLLSRSSCRPIAEQRVVFCLARLFPLFTDFSFIKSVSTEKWKSCISDPRCPQRASSIEGTSIAILHDPWTGAASRQTQEPFQALTVLLSGSPTTPHFLQVADISFYISLLHKKVDFCPFQI